MADPTVVEQPVNPNAVADQAIARRDVGTLTQIAKDNIGTPAGDLAVEHIKTIENSKRDFDKLVEPVIKKGGPVTPEGRIELVTKFKSVADNPQWGTALIAYMTGQKEAAYNLVTGGNPKKSITYDNNGDQIVETINSLGEPLSYFHRGLGRNISEAEYNQLKGGISSWGNSLRGKTETATREESQKVFLKEEEQANNWHQLLQSHKPLLQDTYNTLKTFKTDLPADLYNKIVGSVSQSMGQANTLSRGKTALNQITDAAARGESVKVDEKLASSLGLGKRFVGAELRLEGNQLVSKDNSFKVDISKLKQQQDTENISSEASQNASSTMASLAEAERLGQVNPVAAQRLRRVIESSQQMGREVMDATQKYGKPSFISLPTSASFTDKQAQTLAQTLQSMQNVDQMDNYIRYRRKATEGYQETNTVPLPGEIGTNYTRQPLYNDMRSFFANKIGEVMQGEYQAREKAATKPAPTVAAPVATPVAAPAVEAKPIPKAPAAPPAQKPSTGPVVGKVEDGYRFKGGNPADSKNWEKVK